MNLGFSFRQLFALGALLCLSLLGSAYLLEYAKELKPCPLCMFQRALLWILTLVFLAGTLWPYKRKWRLLISSLVIVFALAGSLLAWRQVFLQSLPIDQMPACTAGLERLLAFHSALETFQIVLSSSGECGIVDYRILGFSLASWSLMVFVLLIFYGAILLYLEIGLRRKKI